MSCLINLSVFVLCIITFVGGWLRTLSGDERGWVAVGVTMAIHALNCASLAAVYLQRPT
jgi:hypothetical protein